MFICIQCGNETFGSQMCGSCVAAPVETSRSEYHAVLTEEQQQELEALVRESAQLPHVIGSELTPEELVHLEDFYRTDPAEDGSRRKWCNNFHNLFLALYDQLLQPAIPLNPGEHRLRRIESTYGPVWQEFLLDNQELVQQILTQLQRYPIVARIRRLTIQVIREHNWDEASLQPIHDRFDPVVGIDCITMAFWKELDPLLRQAWKAMEEAGVDPRTVDG